ncbi:MAG: carboxymuconolactone decarboxylase family protein [Reichenbachiella sp.]|uniref:carboxymuconolactone decarboxylase family protein n=1 Tax=Reichenbachiella sp. TaxID=2184521 RepID=UPI00329A522C
MIRLNALSSEQASGKTKELFEGINSKLGTVPNMMRTMGNSSAVLEGYLNLSGALAKGALGGKMGELIAMTVAEANACNYCLSAHAFIGEKMVSLNRSDLMSARVASHTDSRTKAGLEFAKTLVEKKGVTNDADVDTVRNAGYSEGEIVEIIAHVALNVFTNYMNNTANTEVDFPLVEAKHSTAA